MNINVDKKNCDFCRACIEECPIKIIEADEKNRVPKDVEYAEKYCILCGHCVCVCPKGALSLEKMSVESCAELPKDWRLTPEQAEKFFKGRRSIRCFKNKTVEKSIIEKIFDIARYAPTGVNRQNVFWMVVYDKDRVKKLAELTINWMKKMIAENSPLAEGFRMRALVNAWEKGEDRICRGAPHILIAYSLKEDPTAAGSCMIALAHADLACLPFDLGACWAGYLNMALNSSEEAFKYSGINSRMKVHGALLIGYPKYNYARIPVRKNARIEWNQGVKR